MTEILIIIRRWLVTNAWIIFLIALLLLLIIMAILILKFIFDRSSHANISKELGLTFIGVILTLAAETISAPYIEHGYKLYKDNVNWETACYNCQYGEFEDIGAHLVYISDEKEFLTVIDLLNKDDTAKTLEYIWIGATCREFDIKTKKCLIEWGDSELEWSEKLDQYWLDGEPSHSYYNRESGAVIEEQYICLVKRNGEWKLNDVSDDFLNDEYDFEQNQYKNKVGYLCEYADEH